MTTPGAFSLLVGGAVAIDFHASPYGVADGSLTIQGEPGLDAEYADAPGRDGAALTSRRFENRVVSFGLKIEVTGTTNAQKRLLDYRNAVADVLEKARAHAAGDAPGTTASEGEVVLKYRRKGGGQARYARVIGGAIGSNPREHSAFTGLKTNRAVDFEIPVSLILEPDWTAERPHYWRNCLLNGGFEGGYGSSAADVPDGWTFTAGGGLTVSKGRSTSFARSGVYSYLLSIDASASATATNISQAVTYSTAALAVGQTVCLSAWVYVYTKTGTGRARLILDWGGGVTREAATTATGWTRLSVVADLRSGTTSVTAILQLDAQNAGDTITAFWDEIQLHPHADNLLLGGSFDHDTEPNNIGDGWTRTDTGALTVAAALSSAVKKYDSYSQAIQITAGDGQVALRQDASLGSAVRVGDALTLGAWLNLLTKAGNADATIRLSFLDSGSRTIQTTDATAVSTAGLGWGWLSATATVPPGAITVRAELLTRTNGSNAILAYWDFVTLYRGHSDQADRRLWPYADGDETLLPAWTDAARLTNDPAATDARQIALAYAGLPGNVPGPCRLVVGVSDTLPHPLIVGNQRLPSGPHPYQAGAPYADASSATVFTGSGVGAAESTGDPSAIGNPTPNYRLWTPAGTTEVVLMNWSGADVAPGRYLIVVRVKLGNWAHYDRFSFRAGVRLDAADSTAGAWAPILHPAPPWVSGSSADYQLWPAGVVPLPLRHGLPAYANASRVEISGRCSSTAGSPTARIDGVFFVPVDGYYEGQKSYYATIPPASGNPDEYAILIDSLTPTPGGVLADTGGTFPAYLPASFDDQPDAREDPIRLGETGRLVAIWQGAAHVKTYTTRIGIFHSPRWTTAGAES